MALRDITNNAEVVESVRPQVASAGVNGEAVDTRGADSVMFAVSIGAITGTADDAAVTLEASDDGSTGWAAVSSDDIIGETPTAMEPNTAYQFGYSGDTRYLRAVLDIGGETDVAASVTATLCHLHRRPPDFTVDSEA